MLTIEEALQAVQTNVEPAAAEARPLQDCLRCVLAEDLITPHDSPPFDKSMMDGFAVNTAGFPEGQSVSLPITETITAGTVPSAAVTPETASRIMTGAAIPDGADCVVPIEHTVFDPENPQTVRISADKIEAGRNILTQGISAASGTPLMPAGTMLEPQHIAVLAEFGVANVPVYRRPDVAVLTTGDELLPIDQPLTPGHIRNSNEPMLVSQIQRADGIAHPLGVAKDERADLQNHIRRGLQCDFLLLSGGVSAGTLDLVPSELAAAGVVQVFHKIQMKPGKPLWFGKLETDTHSCRVFGLPGNPVSSMICFELFVRTALRKFSGLPNPEPTVIPAELTDDVTLKGDRVTCFPTSLQQTKSGLKATPVKWGGSADLRSTADANGMCILSPAAGPFTAGTVVDTIQW